MASTEAVEPADEQAAAAEEQPHPPPPLPPPPAACKAALLQTRDLLSDCAGVGADWLTNGSTPEQLAAEEEREEEDATEGAAPAGEHVSAAATAAGDGHGEDGQLDGPPSVSSAAAEFFTLTPLPPLGELPDTLSPPPPALLPHAGTAPLAWHPHGWSDAAAAEACSGSAASLETAATSGTQLHSVALSSPGSQPGVYAPEQQAGGEATQPAEQQQQQLHPRRLRSNAAYEPRGEGAADPEERGSPAAQLARLLGSPLTPDAAPTASSSGADAGGGSAARITPGSSPADGGPAAGEGSGSALPTDAASSQEQQALVARLHAQAAALQRQASELLEALAAAEARTATHAEQAHLLRAQAASAEERQAAAQQRTAQAVAAAAEALRQQQAAQHAAADEAAQRSAAEERQRQLEEQLQLMFLERSETALAGAPPSASLLGTAAELAAGGPGEGGRAAGYWP